MSLPENFILPAIGRKYLAVFNSWLCVGGCRSVSFQNNYFGRSAIYPYRRTGQCIHPSHLFLKPRAAQQCLCNGLPSEHPLLLHQGVSLLHPEECVSLTARDDPSIGFETAAQNLKQKKKRNYVTRDEQPLLISPLKRAGFENEGAMAFAITGYPW